MRWPLLFDLNGFIPTMGMKLSLGHENTTVATFATRPMHLESNPEREFHAIIDVTVDDFNFIVERMINSESASKFNICHPYYLCNQNTFSHRYNSNIISKRKKIC